MQKQITLKLKPEEAALPELVHQLIAQSAGVAISAVTGYRTLKQSIDARSRQQVWINLTLQAFINEPFVERERISIPLDPIKTKAKTVIIIGAGPAGLFAALELIELGIKPIILERGKDVKARRRDLAVLNKEGIINPDSNYCFGEGGAGTYSDGKLYTRSSKRGSIDKVLQLFYQFGAEEKILYQSHPHIGTNKLPQIISAMREQIIAAGGEVHFETKVTNMVTKHNSIHELITANGNRFSADAYILATGHSARDIFRLLHQKNILIEAKPFALGVRIEHPQSIIDAAQYHCDVRGNFLPPASYSLVEQVNQRGVFSFCMCPGGIIATASTDPGELVVNGWSPSKRNNPFANSGMVVQVAETDALNYFNKQSADALLLMDFQQSVEQKAYNAGGGKFVAPAQRMVDFCNNKPSSNLPDCSYLPGLAAANLKEVLPNFIRESLQGALKMFGAKMKGYYTNDAVLVATESRTSSPIRIPRDAATLTHPQLNNLYPCGEGAGYAGGIVSAAMDGQKLARQIHLFFLCL
jgi:uncharacterized FAD-dependent dehydrogenase